MSGDIVLSTSVRSNLLALQSTADLLARTQQRLATGKRVNSALDSPVNFFASAALNDRASSLNSLLDAVDTAIRTLEAADNGVTSIKKLIESAEASARQALLSNGTTARATGSVAGLDATSSFSVTATKTITVSDGTTTATITSAGAVTVQDIIDGVNNAAGLKVKASLSSDGRVQLEATDTNTIVVGGTASAAEKLQFGLADGTTAAGTLDTRRTNLAAQYDELLNQIDKLAQDSGFNGVDLLYGGSLKVVFNESTTSFMTIAGVTSDSSGLGLKSAGSGFQTDYDVNVALGQLRTAANTLQSQSSTFGSNLSVIQIRHDFIKNMISTLRTGADHLVLADTNEEGANMLALQTRQQLSQTALSLAAQADQNVLRLFGG